jgi:hypothetical protein
MPATDEDFVRDLMHRATGDLHARSSISADIVSQHRSRHRRTRALGLTATGAAAVTAFGVIAATSGGGPARPAAATPVITLTAAQQTLDHLSSAAAAAHTPAGRYVTMKELAGTEKKTTIVDSKTGDVWTFQQGGHGIPKFLFSRDAVTTEAQFAAYPTRLHALRALLIAQGKKEQAQAVRFGLAAIAIKDKGHVRQARRTLLRSTPKETANDYVFSQASYLLWNPVVTPSLRAALLKVLAATPGVVVNAHTKDSIGRPAVEISRFDSAADYTVAIFEAPDATGVLETSSLEPAKPAQGGLPAQAASTLSDTYLSITRGNTRPTA